MKKLAYCFLLVFCLSSCSKKYLQFTNNYTFKSTDGKPDYSDLDYWAAHPYKHDTSDSIPKPLLEKFKIDSSVDVFFLHPTTYVGKQPFGWYAPVDDATLNSKTDYGTILYQASIFNEVGRVFAPRYRQAHFNAYTPKSKEQYSNAVAAFDTAYADIKLAFEYYLQHYNNGKPIIIAAHSQGATHAKRLLKEFFDGTLLQNRLVVAYLVGMPVEPNYFTNISLCATPVQTSCFCSWRTYKTNYKSEFVAKENFTALVTNPLTWDVENTSATREKNTGAILLKFNKIIRHITNAKVEGGILWADKPHFFGNIFLRTKNYHIADMNFYYMNIRENVANRTRVYYKK